MDKKFVRRINELVKKAGGQSALARKSGLSLGAIQRYLRGGDPSRKAMIKISEACGVTLNWLAYGMEEAESASSGSSSLPLYGFRDSGDQGWYNEVKYKIGAPLELSDPDSFALVSPDRAMSHEGIKPGFVCVVSPNTAPVPEDVVFVRRNDGTASLKVFEKQDSEWCYTSGYIDPGDGEELVFSSEQIKLSSIKQLGPVVLVKRR